MLKRGLGIGLLCVAGHAYSAGEIIVNTQTDEDRVNNNQCSLREAIDYINQGMPESGLYGCGGKDAIATILLEPEKTYSLNAQIKVTKSLQLRTLTDTTIADDTGTKNATIKAAANERIFYIHDDQADSPLYSVNLTELNLEGNPSASIDQGGLIYNHQILALQYVQLKNGHARQGGAIYNAGQVLDRAGYVAGVNSKFLNNTAEQGAVIYGQLPSFLITQSVLSQNAATNSVPVILYSAGELPDRSEGVGARIYGVTNASIFNNKGYATNLRDGMRLNNLTVVGNDYGLYLQSLKGNSSVSNSIVAGNRTANCTFLGSDRTDLQNNLTNTSANDCGNGNSIYPNIAIANEKLIAGSSLEGSCDLAPAAGLLCPYYVPEGQFLGFFKPRLLMSYSSLNQSLIVNRGQVSIGGATAPLLCELVDQRNRRRSQQELCDIGAIELVVDPSSIGNVGKDIRYSEIAKFTIADQLADGELLPASECEKILGKREDQKPWQAGCLQIQQTNTPSKGGLVLDQMGNITYTPNSNWHGSDEFNLRVMTTITRFNESLGSQYISIPTRIVQEPTSGIEDKTVKTSGGSTGLAALIGLLGLIGIRRFRVRSNKDVS